jgi:hypothetical protein
MKSAPVVVAVLGAAVLAAPVHAQKAVPSVELTDPAGDVQTFNGAENARDVVKLRLGSDGASILVGATLANDERGTLASSVVELYLDTDNKAATGGKTATRGGFEYVSKLSVCMAYSEDRIGACAGGPGLPPKNRYARIVLDQFTGAAGEEIKVMNSHEVVSGMGYVEKGETPLQGRVLEGKIPYAKLGVKPGQVVRIVAREWGSDSDKGYFPDVLLALK